MTVGLISPIFAIFAAPSPSSQTPERTLKLSRWNHKGNTKFPRKTFPEHASCLACYIKTQARGKEGEKEKKENTNFPTKSETVVLIKPHPRVYIYILVRAKLSHHQNLSWKIVVSRQEGNEESMRLFVRLYPMRRRRALLNKTKDAGRIHLSSVHFLV